MNKLKSFTLLFAMITLFTFSSCDEATKESAPQPWKAEHVIFIGLDGWGSYSVNKADMPHTKQLMSEGSYTLQKRTVLPSSSAVNWASMFMGAGPELHGYTTWGSQTPDMPSRELNQNDTFPNMFQLIREIAPEAELGMMSEWEGIKFISDTIALTQYTKASTENGNLHLRDLGLAYIKENKPTFTGIIFDSPDDVGHGAGHDTPEYYEKLAELDGYIGEFIQAAKDAGIYDNTIFIVTSDHGGIDKDHGGKTMMEMETPFIIAGKGIKATGEFNESMMQYDVAPTIIEIFNLKGPQVWVGRSMSQVFK